MLGSSFLGGHAEANRPCIKLAAVRPAVFCRHTYLPTVPPPCAVLPALPKQAGRWLGALRYAESAYSAHNRPYVSFWVCAPAAGVCAKCGALRTVLRSAPPVHRLPGNLFATLAQQPSIATQPAAMALPKTATAGSTSPTQPRCRALHSALTSHVASIAH